MAEINVITDKREALNLTNGTSLRSKLIGITYDDLESIFGEPVFKPGDGDSSVNFEWVVEYDGDIFTIYDWKYPDANYVKDELGHDGGISFHVGGKTYAGDFEDWIDNAKEKGISVAGKQDDELPF